MEAFKRYSSLALFMDFIHTFSCKKLVDDCPLVLPFSKKISLINDLEHRFGEERDK